MQVFQVASYGFSVGASVTSYVGLCGGGGADGTEANVQIDVQTAGTLDILGCYMSANDRTGSSTLVSRVGGANGNMSVTIGASSGAGQFEDAAHSDTWDATEEVNGRFVVGAGGTTFVPEAVWSSFTGTSITAKYFQTVGTSSALTTADQYYPLAGGNRINTSEAIMQWTAGAAATLRNAFSYVSANTRSDTVTYRTRKNASTNGNAVLEYLTTATGDVNDTSNTDTVAQGDEWNWIADQNGGSGSLTLRILKIEVEMTTAFPLLVTQSGSSPTTQANALTRYLYVESELTSNFDTTEADKQTKSNQAFTWGYYVGYVSAQSIDVTGTYVLRPRVNGADVNGVLTWNFGETGQKADTSSSDAVADEDEIGFSSVTTGLSGSVTLRTISSHCAGAAAGRTTKNTRAFPLGTEIGMNFVSGAQV